MRFMGFAGWALVVAAAAGAQLAGAGRDPRPVMLRVNPRPVTAPSAMQVPGTIRSRIVMVPVDVRVLDRDGNPVTDLRAEDFTVLEDGVPQTIEHFATRRLAPDAAAAPARPALRRPPGPDVEAPNHRIFLIVLGRGRLQPPAKGLDGLLRFVHEYLLPQDLVALLAYNRATDFTADRPAIAAVLERFKTSHERIDARIGVRMSGLAGVYGSREIPASIQAEIDGIFRGEGLPRFRRLPPGRITDAGRIEEDTRKQIEAIDPLDVEPFDEYIAGNVQTMHDLGNLYAGIEYLRHLDGEKHLIFVTERGLVLPRVENDRSLAALANDARVAISTIQTGGVHADHPGRKTLSEEAWRRTFAGMALQNISRLTGGQSSLFRYADAALRRIDRATRAHYLLGYYPTRPTWDGAYRRISVRVNRPGVEVLFRQGYYARDQLVPLDRRQFLTYSRIAAAAAYGEDIRDIALTVEATMSHDGDARQVVVRTRIDPARLAFSSVRGRHVGSIDLAIFWGDHRERLLAELRQKIDLELEPDAFRRMMHEGMTHTTELDVDGPPRYVKVIVYDHAADAIGSAGAQVR